MSAHTPGPWTVKFAGSSYWIGSAGTSIAHVMPIRGAESNAELLAAAWDLLDALKTLRIDANRLCDRNLGGTYEDDCRHAIAIADAAIAKAEGR